MFLTHVPCTGCHTQLDDLRVRPSLRGISGAKVARATADSCDHCHKPGLGQMQVPLWQRNTRQMYDDVQNVVQAARAHLAGPDGASPGDPLSAASDAAKLIRDAEELLEIVRLDGSWGVHNPRYTQSLLDRARTYAVRAMAESEGQP